MFSTSFHHKLASATAMALLLAGIGNALVLGGEESVGRKATELFVKQLASIQTLSLEYDYEIPCEEHPVAVTHYYHVKAVQSLANGRRYVEKMHYGEPGHTTPQELIVESWDGVAVIIWNRPIRVNVPGARLLDGNVPEFPGVAIISKDGYPTWEGYFSWLRPAYRLAMYLKTRVLDTGAPLPDTIVVKEEPTRYSLSHPNVTVRIDKRDGAICGLTEYDVSDKTVCAEHRITKHVAVLGHRLPSVIEEVVYYADAGRRTNVVHKTTVAEQSVRINTASKHPFAAKLVAGCRVNDKRTGTRYVIPQGDGCHDTRSNPAAVRDSTADKPNTRVDKTTSKPQ